MKILFCGYRGWAASICDRLRTRYSSIEFIQVLNKEDFNKLYKQNYYDLLLFVGWSWIVGTHILEKEKCICLHPSKLPLYRGGSPIQNQIIDGVTQSAVTLFFMDEEIDHGPIIWQHPLNLEGDLECIFESILNVGTKGFIHTIDQYISTKKITSIEQDHTSSTICKRRTPSMSEITLEDLKQNTALDLYNKIRSLQDPYPNAYIKCRDNTVLYIVKAKL